MTDQRIDAYVFDAYGTLFDVHAVSALAERLAAGRGPALVQLWRAKQLEYTWLTNLMERRHDFAQVTKEALDYALAALDVPLEPAARNDLANAWLDLAPFPDAKETLQRLAGKPRWILSNGTRAMLDPLIAHSGLGEHLEGVLSVDAAGSYKPSPRVYALVSDRLRLQPERIGFVSANCWDAIGARAFGFTTWWINRGGLPVDRHGTAPDFVVGSLRDVASLG
jgi:2-haloacid dehalogenase